MMKTLTRKVCVFSAALILAVVLTSATELPRRAYAGCGSDVSWQIRSEWDDSQTTHTVGGKTTDTQDTSTRSEQHSNNGQDSTSSDTHHVNPDGSSHGHHEFHYSDSEGKGCYSDGVPGKGDLRGDYDVDAKGNYKRHVESINEKGGKCTKYVDDYEWDSKGKLIKETHTKTEVPCGKYNLEVSWKGTYTLPSGLETVTYGPNTAKVYLEPKGDGTYEGKYESVFDAKVTGVCIATGTIPVTFNITAKEVKFGDQDELEFSVKRSHVFSWATICPEIGLSGGSTSPTITHTHTFTLPAEDGASETSTSIGPIWTFTLKKR